MKKLVPRVGLEPTQHCCQGSLNPSCLPIPPPGRGDPRRTRTFDPLVKSQLLYRLSYEVMIWLAWQELNLRITGSKPVALPDLATGQFRWWRGRDSNPRTQRNWFTASRVYPDFATPPNCFVILFGLFFLVLVFLII